MDQVIHDRIGWFGKQCRLGARWPRKSRLGICGALCATLTLCIAAGSASAQLLMSDNFDEVGNTNGAAPAGWTLNLPASTQASIVNSSVTTPESAPYCVELTDNSGSSRPEIYQTFGAESNGIAMASYKVTSTGVAPAYFELKTSSGTFLAALILDSNGLVGYDNTGSGTVDTTISWTPGVWQKLQIEWFADETFNAYIGGTQIVQRASFASAAVPSRISLLAGTNAGTGRTLFADDVQVVVAQTLLSDNFDSNETVGNVPSGWVVTTPAGTSNLIVNSAVQPPLSSPNCVELIDNGGLSGPQMYTNFTGMADGRIFYSALIPSTNRAPLDMQLRDTNGNFLVAIRLAENGSMTYNDTPGGNGPFTATAVSWTTNAWQTIRVDWFSNYTFSVHLGSNQIVANAPFSTNTIPARVLFRSADSTSTNCLAFVDNVNVSHPAFPGSANYTNNAMWLGYNYLGSQSYWSQTPELAFQMKTNYRVAYWFINVGSLDTNGVLQGSVANVTNFLSTLKMWEDQQGYRFKVFAWVNGDMPYSGGPTTGVNVNIASVASNIVMEAEKLVSTNVAGSYITKSTRAFDGVQLDLEPAGPNGSDTQYFNIVKIIVNIKSAFRSLGVGNKLTSFTSPSYTTSSTNNNIWDWPPMYYYNMATNIDLLCAMTYDTGYTSSMQYQNWIQDQTTNILKMVSGRHWSNDSLHPAPTNGVEVMIGFPAFPNSSNHTNTVENISVAARGVQAGLTNLQSRGDLSTNYFLGATVYLQNDGTGNDGFASYDTDWWWFGQYWLNTWADLGAPANLLVSPASLNFGSAPVGGTNNLQFSVINSGFQSLTGSATVAGPFLLAAGVPYNVGVGQTQTVTVSFAPPSTGGFTNVVIFTSNGGNSTNTVTGTGAVAPTASFTAIPRSGVEPLTVTFTDTSTGTAPLNLSWNLGDNTATNTTGGAVFAHSYAAGTYTVTLTASNTVGASTIVSNNLITVLSAFQAWQLQYFNCTNCLQAQAGADPYGKGLSNTNQFLLGLNPTNPASVFQILGVAPHGSDLQITWATAGGITNVVQASTGSADGSYSTNFVDVSPSIIIQGSGDTTTNYLNTGAVTNFSTLYYRIRLQQ
jgi:PKD repeat protein